MSDLIGLLIGALLSVLTVWFLDGFNPFSQFMLFRKMMGGSWFCGTGMFARNRWYPCERDAYTGTAEREDWAPRLRY